MTVRQARSQQTILNLLRELQQEIDAQDLHLELRRRGQKMGLATVYRALKFLHKEGLIQERPSTNNKSFYSATSSHHQHHLNCLNCQCSIVVADCPISEKLEHWFQSQEFKVYYHTLEFFGLCPDCQNQATCYQNTTSNRDNL
ncbi:MAG: Fur family transcriptional regulator [Xenococcaceae cyanobacterium]